MRAFVVILGCFAVAGCGSAVRLQNPQSGQTVECGPYMLDSIGSNSQAMREAQCISDFQRQGFVRAP